MFLAENKMNHLPEPEGSVNILLIFWMDFGKVIHPKNKKLFAFLW